MGFDSRHTARTPLLLVDVDGVISLFGFDHQAPPDGHYQLVDGIAHFLSAAAGGHLRRLAERFELAWCTGWEEKANDYLPAALGLAGELPFLSFGEVDRTVPAHWKLIAVEEFAGADRAVAWIDDAHDHRCHAWARARRAPTKLVGTDPASGITAEHVVELRSWAAELASGRSLRSRGHGEHGR